MRTALMVLFFLVVFIRAEKNNNSVVTNLATFNVEEEIRKIKNTKLQPEDYMELTGNIVASRYAGNLAIWLSKACIDTIGINELRAAIGLPPLGPWKAYNKKLVTEEQLENASTWQEYYMLKEQKDPERSLGNRYLLESNMASGMAFMEKRFPAMRKIYKYQYGKILEKSGGVVGRPEVDELINMFDYLTRKFYFF